MLTTVVLTGFALADPKSERDPKKDLPYSFVQAPYIHPEIVQDLTTWPSDQGDWIIAIPSNTTEEFRPIGMSP